MMEMTRLMQDRVMMIYTVVVTQTNSSAAVEMIQFMTTIQKRVIK
jgi:hypothetical protein